MEPINEKEYDELRAKRNALRDKFENAPDFLVAGKLKAEIVKIDKVLSEYERRKRQD